MIEEQTNTDKKLFKLSLYLPIFFLLTIWSVKAIEIFADTSFYRLGIFPRQLQGILGIVFSPLIHADFKHLINNSVPFAALSVGLFYFYRQLAYKVFFLNWFIVGIWVWCGARESYHIGASGLVYGLASFLFLSGVLRRMTGLMAVSLIVIFLYGSMVWGIFPFVPDVSWESHLSGLTSGLLLAYYFRNQEPQRKKYEWETEEMDEEEINEMLDEMNEGKNKKVVE